MKKWINNEKKLLKTKRINELTSKRLNESINQWIGYYIN